MTQDSPTGDTPMTQSFGMLFLLARQWEYLANQKLAPSGLTIKQWMVLMAIDKMFEKPPSVLEVAASLSTSHQNIKAIALKLEAQGLIVIVKDEKDRRVLRLKTTAKNKRFWQQRSRQDLEWIADLFSDLEPKEITVFNQLIARLCQTTHRLIASQEQQ